ncbi:MAG: Membrane-bound lytic murein transglycosylase C [Verrucomicrobiae bacterium]|nr:Membrane-bound lytic murein transglycosylase C [Verrucomicrobiae bacterium]
MVRLKKSSVHQFGNLLSIGLATAALVAASTVFYRWQFREQRYDRLIEEIATKHAVDKYLIKAVIRRESEFDPTVRGRVGEIGLMQVTEGAGRDWARANGRKDFSKEMLWNERLNIEVGTWYLARALRRWQDRDDPVPFALAEYNAGYGHCLRWLPNGPATTAAEFRDAISFPMVRRYIATVVEHYEYYRANGDF